MLKVWLEIEKLLQDLLRNFVHQIFQMMNYTKQSIQELDKVMDLSVFWKVNEDWHLILIDHVY
jgi:hypothetical protein